MRRSCRRSRLNWQTQRVRLTWKTSCPYVQLFWLCTQACTGSSKSSSSSSSSSSQNQCCNSYQVAQRDPTPYAWDSNWDWPGYKVLFFSNCSNTNKVHLSGSREIREEIQSYLGNISILGSQMEEQSSLAGWWIVHLGYKLLLLLTSSFQLLVFGVNQRANRGRAGHNQENWNRRHVQVSRFYFH